MAAFDPNWIHAMELALAEAGRFAGATSPNPPVGAAALDENRRVLAVAAHEKAGTAHAEVNVLQLCRDLGLDKRVHTLVVTLEPCNHANRTPPCTRAILEAQIRRVVFGSKDPNPNVRGNGAEALRAAGVEVIEGVLRPACDQLIRTFKHWSIHRKPWVTLKIALDSQGSMLPPPGQKTFTSPQSLRFAHELRKRADAILTGSGTILADQPLFTVRHIADHREKSRHVVILVRRNQVPESYIQKVTQSGFRVVRGLELEESLDFLGQQGCLEVLIEAGPTLCQRVTESNLWNEKVVITCQGPGLEDEISTSYRDMSGDLG